MQPSEEMIQYSLEYWRGYKAGFMAGGLHYAETILGLVNKIHNEEYKYACLICSKEIIKTKDKMEKHNAS
jgi:hypothetical protein